MDPIAAWEGGVTFTRPEFLWLFYLTVGWILVWGGHTLLYRTSATYRASPWPWYRLVGLVLLLFPFIRLLNGIWESIDFVLQPGTQARTPSASQWWRTVRRNVTQNFLVPLVGLWLASGHAERVVAGVREAGRGVRATLRSVGMWPRVSWSRDVSVGLAAFLVVFFAYIALSRFLSPLRDQDTGDASQVFNAITPLLAVALAVMAGVTEEFLYRGVLLVRLRSLVPAVPVWVLLLGSSLVFGLAHAGYGTIGNMIFPFLFGLVMGMLALWMGVWPAVIVHTLVNFMVFLGNLYRAGHGWVVPVANGVLFFALVVPLVYLFVWAYRSRVSKRTPPAED